MINQVLQEMKMSLITTIHDQVESDNPETTAFTLRILNDLNETYSIGLKPSQMSAEQVLYGGYPWVSALGFYLAQKNPPFADAEIHFLNSIKRQISRPKEALKSLYSDDLAILGICDGLSCLISQYGDSQEIKTCKHWIFEIIETMRPNKIWSHRMRSLAAELIDKRDRLKVLSNSDDINELALEIVLRNVWPDLYLGVPFLSYDVQTSLLKQLLLDTPPNELEKAATRLKAIDLLIAYSTQSMLPSISEVVIILRRVQHSLKRWTWEEKPHRKDVQAKWLIDNEYHVQSLLWAVLYPIYGSALVDERYLPNYGFKQPRIDLGIETLKVIIEVKILRTNADFEKVEEEIAADAAIYFKDPTLFNRMVVFIYDDRDEAHPEKYDSVQNALKKRDRIEDVIIVRRPGMIPNRTDRANSVTT